MIGIFGTIKNPTSYGTNDDYGNGLFILLSNIFKLAGYAAGLFFLFQLISAGYGYMSANGDPKKTEAAWAKIYQSLMGIIIVASAFVITGVVGYFLKIDFLTPVLIGPNE